jgi:hypothetical protein
LGAPGMLVCADAGYQVPGIRYRDQNIWLPVTSDFRFQISYFPMPDE